MDRITMVHLILSRLVLLGQRQMSRRDTSTKSNMDPFPDPFPGQGKLLMTGGHQLVGYISNTAFVE